MQYQNTNQAVLFTELPAGSDKKIGHATLNSPASLNSLTTEMVELLLAKLLQWAQDSRLACVVISGAGDKAFCAGGDVQALRNSAIAKPGGPCLEAETFFAREYRLDYTIHTFNKPLLVWGNGIVMGGGLGILAGASHRVVTETSRFAMPEVTIGLYPDVGGSHFLNLMPGETGRFLALTGASFNAADALYTGLADYFLQRDQFPALLEV
ncbi:MAG: enoyl-CoA hydratase/isomerase family protein, partial [Pseudomonadales bacterium]|nr:enoyl-CoA hydratase/isomerase family protein [Pseudomonadales bacterium]